MLPNAYIQKNPDCFKSQDKPHRTVRALVHTVHWKCAIACDSQSNSRFVLDVMQSHMCDRCDICVSTL
jgi:hypothetical protein